MSHATLHDPQMPEQQPPAAPPAAPPAVLENFYWMMSLALDGLLDEADRAEFAARQVEYPALGLLWNEWQELDRELQQTPHVDPAPGFTARFELRLAQHEAQQQQRVLTFSLVAVLLVLLLAVAGMSWAVTFLTSTQGPWLGEQIHNLVYLSATTGAWFGAVFDTLGALANTPQAQALGMMYVVVAMMMIFGWVQLLRRSARLAPAGALPGME